MDNLIPRIKEVLDTIAYRPPGKRVHKNLLDEWAVQLDSAERQLQSLLCDLYIEADNNE